MKIDNIYIIGMLMLVMTFSACGSSNSGNQPTPANIVGSNWNIATAVDAAGNDVTTIFVLQSFTLNNDNTYTATLYPNNAPQTGTWVEIGTEVFNLVANGATISLSNVSIVNNTLSASVTVPAGFGTKTTEFSGTVTYTR